MLTLTDTYQNTLIEMKSKFIAFALPITSVEEFKEKLKAIEKEHHKARHIVYAYRIDNTYKSTDNGEPKGTAGRPLLELLLKKDINNIALIVVRYFGGTKLGAGRLLRIYLNSGIEVLKKAGI
ncbi:MAG: YigZ family protein [Bacilli bacterium]|nr:YigZ family protein [Bacilli bacterium]